MLRRLFVLVSTLMLAFVLPVSAQTAKEKNLPSGIKEIVSVEGINEYRLANGLQVLLAPDASKPTTTVNLTYRVGSRHENYGETGMAHLLEHLIFKGSPRHRDVWAEFTKRGLRANGSTWLDRTNYFASFSADDANLRWYLGWQADAMVNSFISKRDLDTEMTVVRNEMERGENSAGRILLEKGLAAMYQWHNYGKSTIGARSDVENVDIERLQAFYRRYYQPDNATLIVAGRFEPAQVLRWVAESFGKLPKPERKLPALYSLDPAQDGERSVTLRRVGGAPMVYAMYHVPPGAHPDYAAVEMLDLLLTDTPSGRLHRALVDAKLAAGVFGFTQALADPGFAVYGAQLGAGQEVKQAQEALLATVESFAQTPVTQEELQRARTKWLKDWDMTFSDPERVGVALSEAIAAGDWRLFFLARDRIRMVDVADVQRVAKERLLRSNRTLATYIPTEDPQRAPAPARVDVSALLQGYVGDPAAVEVEAFDATPGNIERRTERFTLDSGLQAAVLPKGTRGAMVRAELRLRFGTEQSLQNLSTVGQLTAALLDKGTARLSRQQVQDRLDELRAEVSIAGSATGVAVSITTKRQYLPQVIELVSELLQRPSFPADGLEEIRQQALAALESERKDPEAQVDLLLDQRFSPYPQHDVRHVPSFDERRRALERVTQDDIRAFHRRFYAASHGQFSAVGDLDARAVRAALESGFGSWRAKEPYARVTRPFVEVAPERVVVRTPDRQNAYLRIGLAMPVKEMHPDYPALTMANYLLGQGGNSRLWARVREAEGLSYSVYSMVEWNVWEPYSVWSASAIFAPQNLKRVETAMREEIDRALERGFTQQELEQGRQGLLNFRRLSRAQDRNLAAALVENLYLGRDFLVSQRVDEALAQLTVADVNAALRKYLQPERFVIGAGGDFKE
ncbi:insulinase family protein [Schlegelella sp. S2-27]|uniref:Insulinase family protein n=1 Tax=Caldimonas mangrovi TaxID=2944811 RepID=A0ABT0YM82_9BURK|nr:pitrilysin family protein [Caldimonas mangrovi]MCM5679768.1 insulinase family protein [Caldimonas mangrovi]